MAAEFEGSKNSVRSSILDGNANPSCRSLLSLNVSSESNERFEHNATLSHNRRESFMRPLRIETPEATIRGGSERARAEARSVLDCRLTVTGPPLRRQAHPDPVARMTASR